MKRLIIFFIFICVSLGCIYHFFKSPKNMRTIPLELVGNSYGIYAKIENNSFLLKFDTGSSYTLKILEKHLDSIQKKTEKGFSKSFDINGNAYNNMVYELEKADFGLFKAHSIPIISESLFFSKKGGIVTIPGYKRKEKVKKIEKTFDGRIGVGLLSMGKFWKIDLNKGTLGLIRDLEKAVGSKEINIGEYIETDFLFDNDVIIISVETDFGKKKFLLDTGSEITILRPDKEQTLPGHIVSKKFIIGTRDFGKQNLGTFSFCSEKFDYFDGAIGLDFLKKHPVILNFANKKVYFSFKE